MFRILSEGFYVKILEGSDRCWTVKLLVVRWRIYPIEGRDQLGSNFSNVHGKKKILFDLK